MEESESVSQSPSVHVYKRRVLFVRGRRLMANAHISTITTPRGLIMTAVVVGFTLILILGCINTTVVAPSPGEYHTIHSTGQKIDLVCRCCISSPANCHAFPCSNNWDEAGNVGQVSAQNETGAPPRFFAPTTEQRITGDLSPR